MIIKINMNTKEVTISDTKPEQKVQSSPYMPRRPRNLSSGEHLRKARAFDAEYPIPTTSLRNIVNDPMSKIDEAGSDSIARSVVPPHSDRVQVTGEVHKTKTDSETITLQSAGRVRKMEDQGKTTRGRTLLTGIETTERTVEAPAEQPTEPAISSHAVQMYLTLKTILEKSGISLAELQEHLKEDVQQETDIAADATDESK